jgi:hypothetical protein
MDSVERTFSRERARWRAKLAPGMSLWGFENWATDKWELHHVGRRKYSNLTIWVPVTMHRELTRRQMEEYPPDGDPSDPAECRRRVLLGLFDLLEGLAAYCRWLAGIP